MTLTRSKDRKVTNAVTAGGNVAIANSFGLPSGKAFSCPGATAICARICYAGKLEKIYKGVAVIMLRNWDLLNGASVISMYRQISQMINEFNSECDKRNADKVFRIHWDGDFFSESYANAWAQVIKDNPQIHFWVYTRSFTPEMNVIPILAGIDNLSVYLSVDSYNRGWATVILEEFPDIKAATLAETFAEAKEMTKEITGKNGIACPENAKKIALIDKTGSACVKLCGGKAETGFCVKGTANVQFAIKGR